MNLHLLQMKSKLEVLDIDASPLLRGEPMFDPKDVELHRDKIWISRSCKLRMCHLIH